MGIEIFLKKKQNPVQCKNTADLLGWFGLVLVLQKGYTVSTGWQMLLLVSLGCALWLFAVYIVGLHGNKIRKGTLFHRLNEERRVYIAGHCGFLGAILIFIHWYLHSSWSVQLAVVVASCVLWMFSVYLVGIRN